MKFSLKGKTAVVTGGASGIGKAISQVFATQGAKVHCLDFSTGNLEATLRDSSASGGTVVMHHCDVSRQEEVRKTIDSILSDNSIDILINNAGIAHIGTVETTLEADLDRLYQVNIKGVYNCVNACIGNMKEHGGVIINMASVAASVGITERFAYSMTKGAVLTMTYSIAKDYLDFGIRCNSISPGRVFTPFVEGYLEKNYPDKKEEMFQKLSKTQPIGRMGKPEEIADLALYLCSEEASFITGTDFPIDGGYIKLNG